MRAVFLSAICGNGVYQLSEVYKLSPRTSQAFCNAIQDVTSFWGKLLYQILTLLCGANLTCECVCMYKCVFMYMQACMCGDSFVSAYVRVGKLTAAGPCVAAQVFDV